MSAIVDLLGEAFPAWANLDGGCWVRRAVDLDPPMLDEYSAAVDIVTQFAQRDDLIRRLRSQHPVDRQHLAQHDARLLDAFTEAMSFAWTASVAKLGAPRFEFQKGMPDITVTEAEWWVEAKVVHRSDDDAAQRRWLLESSKVVSGAVRPPGAGFYKKFEDAVLDAEKKRRTANISGGQLVLFINFEGLDIPSLPLGEDIRNERAGWAGVLSKRLR